MSQWARNNPEECARQAWRSVVNRSTEHTPTDEANEDEQEQVATEADEIEGTRRRPERKDDGQNIQNPE